MNITNFAFRVGLVAGGITNSEIQNYLLERGITQEQIEECKLALITIAEAFYREKYELHKD